ncbi:synaptic vesicle 2-related protein-like isoform X2 [Antedon mediterranea]|uniref:synaptic vesicle 2-related protein-like isoform X2 n=1 Tax=Antedon mediterranea TaxID=105859 RepID=UPI003AF93380
MISIRFNSKDITDSDSRPSRRRRRLDLTLPLTSPEPFYGTTMYHRSRSASRSSYGSNLSMNAPTYTVDEAINAIGVGWTQVYILITVFISWVFLSAETLLSTTISTQFQCDLLLSGDQVALLTTSLFIGELVGTWPNGKFVDTYGRKAGMVFITAWTLYYGIIFSFTPTFIWAIAIRFLTGLGLIGVLSVYILYLGEMVPSNIRVWFVLAQVLSYGTGSLYVATIGMFAVPTQGWRYQSFYAALPGVISIILTFFLPESPRYLAFVGRMETSCEVLTKLADSNKVELPPGDLLQTHEIADPEKSTSFQLLRNGYLRQTTILYMAWFACYFAYYGMALTTTPLLSGIYIQEGNASSSVVTIANTSVYSVQSSSSTGSTFVVPPEPRCDAVAEDIDCNDYLPSRDEYVETIVATLGDFIAAPVMVILVLLLGRKRTLTVSLISAASSIILIAFLMEDIDLTFFIFAARAFSLGTYGALFLYTVEVYPTSLRAQAVVTCQFWAKVAGAVTPFVAQGLFEKTPFWSMMTYFFVCIFAGIATIFLEIDPTGEIREDM